MAELARLIFATVSVLTSVGASAQIHKCVAPDGRLSYSQSPCSSTQRNVEVSIRATAPPGRGPAAGAGAPATRDSVAPLSAAATMPAPSAKTSDVVAENRCRPMPTALYQQRRDDVATALTARSNTPEREEALRLEQTFLNEEERHDMLPIAVASRRDELTTKVTSIVPATRMEGLKGLREIYKLGWDWDSVNDPATGATKLLCRSITMGIYGADENCQCKPRTANRWAKNRN